MASNGTVQAKTWNPNGLAASLICPAALALDRNSGCAGRKGVLWFFMRLMLCVISLTDAEGWFTVSATNPLRAVRSGSSGRGFRYASTEPEER